ncbi:hypothetical protein [Rubrobacter radiotolerans]|uniref:Antitoxin n=1 Tax=Rubrobacter radiotolerans TaxID=42256 RepID=A0AB35T9D7_RUBRA|nr:hypothetical protein [Rubrobacter radiotolerans]MDX5895292.1 hypothetical protein [Rubrobacter radiotolerans]SMC01992.1 conserved hypothetical protein [Rubrobacter radiotolerans DSM 5868]
MSREAIVAPISVSVSRTYGDGLLIAVHYSYEGKPATLKRRTAMAKEMLREALDRLEEGEPVDLGFSEDSVRRIRTDKIEA